MRSRSSHLRAVVAACAIVVSVPAVAYAVHPFTDVGEGRFFAEAVDWAYNNGITVGTSATTFSPGVTQRLFDSPTAMSFTIHPDGERFLMLEDADEGGVLPLTLVTHWDEDLDRRRGGR